MKTLYFILILFSHESYAAEKNNHACLKDIQKICPNAIGDKRKLMECINENENKLSSECKTKTNNIKIAAKKRLEDLKKNCTEDAKKLCSGVKPGNGAILKCLRDKSIEASEKCKSLL